MENSSDKKDLDKKSKKSFSEKVLSKSQKSIDRFGKLSIVFASVFLVILISVAVVLTVGGKFNSNTTQDNSTQDYSNPPTDNAGANSNQTVNSQNNNVVNNNPKSSNSVNKDVYNSGNNGNSAGSSSESDNLNQ